MATANIGQNMTSRLDGPPPRSAPARAVTGTVPAHRAARGRAARYTVECSRRVLTPPPVSSSTIRSPAGLRTAAPQSGQVKE
ncbi:hypothetical protein GCM10010236_47390 [Streptomyces eurythermus]|nr:hypothetical protein GCM10010236_47390 [Streptomyces eurythermus]